VTELLVLHNLPGEFEWLRPLLVAGTLIGEALLLLAGHRKVRAAILAAALFLLLLAPASWAVQTVGHPTSGTFPAGGPSSAATMGGPGGGPGGGTSRGGFGGPPPFAQGGFGGGAPPTGAQPGGMGGGGGGPFGENTSSISEVANYVQAHGGGTIGVSSQQGASASIISSDAKVAGIGGFSGRESEVSVQWLAQAVQSGRIRWVLVDSSGGMGFQDGRIGASKVMAAVQQAGTKALTTSGGTLYDLSGKAAALLAASS
jgi:hypothetical protein